MQALFFTRLLLYLFVAATPYLHPGVVVSYDRHSLLTFFLLVPGLMFLAFYMRPPRFRIYYGPVMAALVVLLFSSQVSWRLTVPAGILAYGSTLLVFRRRQGPPVLPVFELFFFFLIYYRMLNFSRSGQKIAEESTYVVPLLFTLALLGFLMHALVIYRTSFTAMRSGKLREISMFAALAVPLLLLAVIILPGNFVKHKIINNLLTEEPPPNPEPIDEELDHQGIPGGRSGRGEEGNRAGQGQGEGGQENHNRNGLPLGRGEEKLPSERAGKQGQGQQGQGQQGQGQQGQGQQGQGQQGQGQQGQGQQGQGQQGQGQQGQGQQGQGQQGQGQQGQGQQGQGQQGQGQQGQGQQGQGQQGQGQQGQESGERNRLFGADAEQWNQSQGQGEGQGQGQGQGGEGPGLTRAIMVLASKIDPVYSAEEYLETFDSRAGFGRTDSRLNHLSRMPLARTWTDPLRYDDYKRKAEEFFYVSSLPDRALPYRPFKIEPTIQDIRYKPFDLTYRAWSMVSTVTLDDVRAANLSDTEKSDLAEFLEANLLPDDLQRIRPYLGQIMAGADSHGKRIETILKSYKRYKYRLGFSDEMATERLLDFLLKDKTGDCSEFAHSAALLGRLSGIPSRVVHGYLGSKDTQTPAHRRGARVMQKQLPMLKDFKPEELYLITNGHHHAWVQFYLPGYGWVDFETTAFAIPPEPQFDPNNADVLIPIIEPEKNEKAKEFRIPYRTMARVALIALLTLLGLLYALRYGQEALYSWQSRSPTEKGVRALARLLVLRLAADGRPLRAPAFTLLEYSRSFPDLEPFALGYNRYLYRSQATQAERADLILLLHREYEKLARESVRPGFLAFLRRLFSLKPLAYLA
ncbi:MAG: transglutaminase domain-containing protein [Spirochaetales bacterium]|nr:transglutaminase domain-containing protein [Spirochaetales bacterium]